MRYNWEYDEWPNFRYNINDQENFLLKYGIKTGSLQGMVKALPADIRSDALIEIMVSEALKTSEIEGEYLSREDIYSSIRKNLGLQPTKHNVNDERAKGIAELIVKINQTFQEQLSENMLLDWHKILMKGQHNINIGKYRSHNSPMQEISGTIGKEIIHFEAPPSLRVPQEMERFIHWYNASAPGQPNVIPNPLVRSAIAHVYFETIHPFEDGNGRIGRFLSKKALSQDLGMPVIISLSKIIEQHKKGYYESLKQAQRTLDLTEWIKYFMHLIIDAQNDAEVQIEFSLRKAKFFDQHKDKLNDRQLKVIRRMLKAGPDGFEGGMNAGKYMSINKTSKASATRDLQALVELDIFTPEGGGRSTRYKLLV